MNEELKVVIKAAIDNLKKNIKEGTRLIDKFGKDGEKVLGELNDAFIEIGDACKAGMAVAATAITGATVAILSLDSATKEYRQNQALLNSSFEAAGASAAQAGVMYNDLYRVLGDDGQAVEAAQHIAQMTTDTQAMAEWGTICQGVYATFGASLPVESLTEAANETAKTGKVTGALADALNWAGISEEEFQKQLDACNTEAEREALIRRTLNGEYGEAAALYEENNAAIIRQNEAQATLNDRLAKIGEAVAPINALLMEFGAIILDKITPYIVDFAEKHLPTLETILNEVATAIGNVIDWLVANWDFVVNIATIIGIVVAALTALSAVMAVVNAVMMASPITWIVLAIVALIAAVAALIVYWDEVKEATRSVWEPMVPYFTEIWENIKGLFTSAWEAIKAIWDVVAPYFSLLWDNIKVMVAAFKDNIVAYLTLAWEYIMAVWDTVAAYFTAIFDTVAGIFSAVKAVLAGDFSAAWEAIKGVFASWGNYFSTLWNSVKRIFSAVGTFFKSIFNNAWNAVKGIFANWAGFFGGLWDSIVKIFTNVGSAIGGAIKNVVSTAVNAVLSTAVNIINGFISAINFAISVINAIPGVSINTLTPLSVPAMAKGGIVDSATLAVVGEQGKEAVVPLENNLEWLDKLAGMLNDRMGGSQPIVLNVDGKRFAEISCASINSLTRQRGSIPLEII